MELTDEQKDIIRHSLGLGYSKKPYRNYYCASFGDPKLKELARIGAMTEGRIINRGENQYYLVTPAGAEAVGSKLPKD